MCRPLRHISVSNFKSRNSVRYGISWLQVSRHRFPLRLSASPAATGFAVTLIKGSSLVTVIGFADLTHVGKQINELTFQPFIVYGAVVLGYFALCFPLSIVSQRLEGKVRAR